MKRRTIAILIGVAALCVLTVIAFRYFGRTETAPAELAQTPAATSSPGMTPAPGGTPTSPPAASSGSTLPDVTAQKKVDDLYSTPVRFYGKVIDEKGDPIPDAHVKIMVADAQWSPGKRFDLVSGPNGLFELTDTNGAAAAVEVGKEGYASTEKSRGMFRLGELRTADDPKIPTPDQPAIFVLQSVSKIEPLVEVRTFIHVPRNGQAVEIDLSTGKAVPAGQGNFRVEAWTHDQNKDAQGRYDWRCKISIPGGGLIERQDSSVFEAPAEGYQSSDEISMPKTAAEWKPRVRRQYFLKLADDRYARMQFEMIAEGDNFFSIKSYVNPTPAARNLASGAANGN
jgi:hypothetical protein